MERNSERDRIKRERFSGNSRTSNGSAPSTKLVSKIESIDKIEKILGVVKGAEGGEARAAARLVLRLCETHGISLEQLRGPSGGSADDIITKVQRLTRAGDAIGNLNDLETEPFHVNDSSALGVGLSYEFRLVQASKNRNGGERGAA